MYVFSQEDVYYSKLYAGSPEVRIREVTSRMSVSVNAVQSETATTIAADVVVVVVAVRVVPVVGEVVLVVGLLTWYSHSSSLNLKDVLLYWNGSIKRTTFQVTFHLLSRNHSTSKCSDIHH